MMFDCFEDSYDRETLIAAHKDTVERLNGTIRKLNDERVQLKSKLEALAETLSSAHEECRTINHTALWKWARGDGENWLGASLGEPDTFSAAEPKRYALFAWYGRDMGGGFNDFLCAFESVSEAVKQGLNLFNVYWANWDFNVFEIVDLSTLKEVFSFNDDTGQIWLNGEELKPKPICCGARPVHANPPPGTEPSGTHHDNDGLDEMRKP